MPEKEVVLETDLPKPSFRVVVKLSETAEWKLKMAMKLVELLITECAAEVEVLGVPDEN